MGAVVYAERCEEMLGWWVILTEILLGVEWWKFLGLLQIFGNIQVVRNTRQLYFKKVVSRAFFGNGSKSYVKDIQSPEF